MRRDWRELERVVAIVRILDTRGRYFYIPKCACAHRRGSAARVHGFQVSRKATCVSWATDQLQRSEDKLLLSCLWVECWTAKLLSVVKPSIYQFMQTSLHLHFMTVNGVNPHSVLVMDNCSIHHVNTTVYEVGALVHFLPPYSPDAITPSRKRFQRWKDNLR